MDKAIPKTHDLLINVCGVVFCFFFLVFFCLFVQEMWYNILLIKRTWNSIKNNNHTYFWVNGSIFCCVRRRGAADGGWAGYWEPRLLLCTPTKGRGVIPAQGVSVLLGIQLGARVADLLLAAFHANYAVKDRKVINKNWINFFLSW